MTIIGKKPYLALAFILTLCGLYLWRDVAAHLVNILWHSEAYNYALIVPLISIYLIYDRLGDLDVSLIRSDAMGLIGLVVAIALHIAGSAADIALFQHLALVLGFISSIYTFLGGAYLAPIIFPLGYLLLMVPFGSSFIPYLQVITAKGSVAALAAVGVPVSTDGVLIHLTSGIFEVAEACAGLKFLMTSLTLGLLLAWLNFKGIKRRLMMVAAALAVAIIANIIRVWSILLISEYSGYEFAKTVDHLIYGWVFLSIVLTIIILLAYRYADSDVHSIAAKPYSFTISAFAIVLSMIIFMAIDQTMMSRLNYIPTCKPSQIDYTVKEGVSWRLLSVDKPMWQPALKMYDSLSINSYRRSGQTFQVVKVIIDHQVQGRELSLNPRTLSGQDWKFLPATTDTIAVGDYKIREMLYVQKGVRMIVWRLLWVDGETQMSNTSFKIAAALSKLKGEAAPAGAIYISALVIHNIDKTRAMLGTIFNDMIIAKTITEAK